MQKHWSNGWRDSKSPNKRYPKCSPRNSPEPGGSISPELSLDFEEALASLPEGARQVFVLHDVEGYRHEEIARMLGGATITETTRKHAAEMLLAGQK